MQQDSNDEEVLCMPAVAAEHTRMLAAAPDGTVQHWAQQRGCPHLQSSTSKAGTLLHAPGTDLSKAPQREEIPVHDPLIILAGMIAVKASKGLCWD